MIEINSNPAPASVPADPAAAAKELIQELHRRMEEAKRKAMEEFAKSNTSTIPGLAGNDTIKLG